MTAAWVFCGGMLRSGSTLQYNIAAELVERSRLGRREQWCDDHEKYFTDSSPGEMVVFKSHILTPQIMNLMINNQAKALLSYRDVRDAVASWQVKTGTTLSLDEAVEFSDTAINQLSCWEGLKLQNLLISRYEIFWKDIATEVGRVSAFLDLDTNPILEKAVAEAVSIEGMSTVLRESHDSDLTKSGPFTWNTKTLVHVDHLNGGHVGRYQCELSLEVQSCLTERHKGWLLERGYELF